MPNLIIYAPPYKSSSGKVMQACIKIKAAYDFGYYKSYPYLSRLLLKNKQLKLSDLNENSSNELLTRARRLFLFSDISDLRPVKFSKKRFGKLVDRVCEAGESDHLNYWISPFGTPFVLNEPYRIQPEYISKLTKQGLIAIELPTCIAPYCGRWNPVAGSKPGTRSFLICDANDAVELDILFSRYYERIQINSMDDELIEIIELIPAWNSLEGIKHA